MFLVVFHLIPAADFFEIQNLHFYSKVHFYAVHSYVIANERIKETMQHMSSQRAHLSMPRKPSPSQDKNG
jgi:hypothetical protein